jgi:hypothetical protein
MDSGPKGVNTRTYFDAADYEHNDVVMIEQPKTTKDNVTNEESP